MFFHRVTAYDRRSPTSFVRRFLTASLPGTEMTYVGERCSIVTWAAPVAAIAGTRVTAVAPEPMTTTRLPMWSRSSGQCCGCTTRPRKRSWPSKCGV